MGLPPRAIHSREPIDRVHSWSKTAGARITALVELGGGLLKVTYRTKEEADRMREILGRGVEH